MLTRVRYLIVAYNTSIQVYSAADSLLVRRIPISTLDSSAPKGSKPAIIVAMRLSKRSPNLIWVACSDGHIYHVDWTKKTQSLESFHTKSGTAKAMVVLPMGDSKKGLEVVLVAESDKSFRLDIVAYLATKGQMPQSKNLLSLKKNGNGLHLLESSDDGQFLTGALNDRIFIGVLNTESVENLDQLRQDFFSFDAPDLITSLDLKIATRNSKKSKADIGPVVDIIAGGARGGIYLYHDAVSRLQTFSKSKSDKETIQAQKLHWHRKAVHSVKWSRDGKF